MDACYRLGSHTSYSVFPSHIIKCSLVIMLYFFIVYSTSPTNMKLFVGICFILSFIQVPTLWSHYIAADFSSAFACTSVLTANHVRRLLFMLVIIPGMFIFHLNAAAPLV